MPIVISRKTGEVQQPVKLTQEQSDLAWELILKAFIAAHPEALSTVAQKED